ncbi:unnamed protein product [Closterium sp. Yama58-4]|nr:unnamed protein product [Closterium sp. Yama58-4]
MEEQLISKAVREGVPWDQLPKRAKLFLGSNEEYIRRIKEHCFQLRLRWPDSPARLVCREVDYYNELIAHGRKTQAPFPYHLADYICRVLRISPFRYYSDLLLDVMKQEKSYDTIPNFTAADALRETGIGRNQFIDIMNRARAKVRALMHSHPCSCHLALMHPCTHALALAILHPLKDMLPLDPVPFPIQPWWLVCLVNLTADEYRRLTEEELSVIERGGHEGDCMAGEFDDDLVRALYCKGLVYLDVPVYPNDRFRGTNDLVGFDSCLHRPPCLIDADADKSLPLHPLRPPSSAPSFLCALLPLRPPSSAPSGLAVLLPPPRSAVSSLEGFVSNRNQQGEDASEKLLYSLFVTASEQATVHEMALTLQADVRQLGAAISLACRLGWAEKVLDLHSLLDHIDMGADADTGDGAPGSEGFGVGDGGVGAGTGGGEGGLEGAGGGQVVGWKKVESVAWGDGGGAERLRIALMVDANLTSFLMMGSFSYELKQHAVTLFEAGKLSERSVAELCGELRAVEKTQLEGELQKFTDHAFSLRYALSCLRTGTIDITSALHTPPLLLPPPPPQQLSHRPNPPLALRPPSLPDSVTASQATSSDAKSTDAPDAAAGTTAAGLGPSRLQEKPLPPRAASYPALPAAGARDDDGSSSPAAPPPPAPATPASTVPPLPPSSSSSAAAGAAAAGAAAAAAAGAARATFNRVELLRTESLQGLAPATLHRLLRRDFDLVVSIVPLPKPLNAVVPDGSGPAHFGPPAPAFLSPWAKLFLYAKTASGPVSVVLMRGLRLRLLPPPLVTCDKALVWTWDGMAVGGVGAKSEGSLVPGTVLLHVVNSLLRHSAVMVQPLAAPPAPAPGFSRTGSNSAARAAGGGGGVEGGLWVAVEGGAGQQRAEEESAVVAAARRAAEVLAVDAVGFVRVMRTEAGEDEDDEEEDGEGGGVAGPGSASGEGRLRIDVSDGDGQAAGTGGLAQKKQRRRRQGEWVAHSVEFGIPLFDTQLCCQVCDAVVSHSMLTPPQLASQRRSTLSLRASLREFICDYRQHGPVSRAVYNGNVALLRSTSRRWSASFATSAAAASPFSVLLPRRTVRHVPPSPSGRAAGERSVGRGGGRRGEIGGVIAAAVAAVDAEKGGGRRVGDRRGRMGQKHRLSRNFSEFWYLPENQAPSFAATQDDPQDPYAQSNRDPSFTSEEEEDDLSRPAYPGVNMIFDGHLLLPIDLSTYLHGRQASVLVARATSMSQQSIMW